MLVRQRDTHYPGLCPALLGEKKHKQTNQKTNLNKTLKAKMQRNSCSTILLYCKILSCLVINYTEISSFVGGYVE